MAHRVAPACKVYGAEPAAGNDGSQSLRAGHTVHIDTPQTIANGAQNQQLGRLTFPIIQRLVEDIVEVSDAELVDSMRFFAERMKIIVEPTGYSSFAAAQELRAGSRIGIIVSGGFDTNGESGHTRQMLKAARLRPGDTVGIISPSWGGAGQFPHRARRGIEQLHALGFNTKLGIHALNSSGAVSDTPENRAAVAEYHEGHGSRLHGPSGNPWRCGWRGRCSA